MARSPQSPLNSWDSLKIIALLLMFVDHSGVFLFTRFPDTYWLRAIGRGAAPIFLFLAGYASSYRFSREIFLLGLLLAVFDTWVARHVQELNILFTILACRAIFGWLERRGKIIQRPWEWYIGAVSLFMTMWLVQYGSIGFLFALAGYVARRPQHYRPWLRGMMLVLAFVTYGFWEITFSSPPISIGATIMVLSLTYLMLSRFHLYECNRGPLWLRRAAKLMSYYSAYIYVLHIMALEILTGIPL